MSDLSALLAPIREREAKATEGPWTAENYLYPDPEGRIRVTSPSDSDDYNLADSVAPPDAAFIASARTDIPRLLAALDKVLALHKPIEVFEYDDMNGVFKVDADGEQILMATYCRECTPDYALELIGDCEYDPTDDNGEVAYPCPTVTAVTAALGEQA